MCVILHNLKQRILQTDQLRDKPEEEEPNANFFTHAIKPLFPLGSVYHSLLVLGKNFSLSPLLATLLSLGWAAPWDLDFLSGKERGSCGPTAASCGDAQEDSPHSK